MKKSIQPLLVFITIAFASLLSAQNNIVFILDGSGSMWQKLDGEFKIAVARTVMKDLVAKLPDSTRAGLVAYGHNRKSDCDDIETLVNLAPLDKVALSASLDAINPTGMTPIAKSIRHTLQLLENEPEEVTIILVSDGLETCDGDACDLIRQAKDQGTKITVHVVGFGIEDKDLSALECIAQAGNGRYLPANNAGELTDALDKTIEPPVQGDSYLSVKVTLRGKLVDGAVKVFPEGKNKEITAGRTYSASSTNPRLFLLPAGNYEVEIQAITLDEKPVQKLTNLTLTAGDTLAQVVDFSNGTLRVKTTRNGNLSDAIVKVFKTGERKEVAASRTYRHEKSNPTTFDLLPGSYDLEIKSIEIAGDPAIRLENQLLKGGDTLSFAHNFSSGDIRIGARQDANLVDAAVTIRHQDSGQEADRGRTYAHDKSNPKPFTLEPGTYKVEVKPIKPKGLPLKVVEVTVETGGVVEKWAEW